MRGATHRAAPVGSFAAKAVGVLGKANPFRYVKKIDRYIIKKFIGTYFYSIALIISISIVFDINENLAKFSTNNAPLRAIVFDYYANFVPYFANLFSPLFVFIAVIFFTSKLAGNSEIIAMMACGMSFKRLLRPYMISAALISALNFYLGAYVIPQGTVVRHNFESLYKNNKKNTSASNVQLQVGDGVIAYIAQYDNIHKTGYGFSLDKFVSVMREFETDTEQKLSTMSAGQLKKTYISFCLACNTKYLFMDEPTNGLDIPSKAQFRSAVLKYTDENATLVISTHQVRDLENVIDPIIILEPQDVLLNASVEEISSRLFFDYGSELHPESLYSEQLPGGFIQVYPNRDGRDSRVNIEALFNAAHRNREVIKSLFSK